VIRTFNSERPRQSDDFFERNKSAAPVNKNPINERRAEGINCEHKQNAVNSPHPSFDNRENDSRNNRRECSDFSGDHCTPRQNCPRRRSCPHCQSCTYKPEPPPEPAVTESPCCVTRSAQTDSPPEKKGGFLPFGDIIGKIFNGGLKTDDLILLALIFLLLKEKNEDNSLLYILIFLFVSGF